MNHFMHKALRSIRAVGLLLTFSMYYAACLPGQDMANRTRIDSEFSTKQPVGLSEKIIWGLPSFRGGNAGVAIESKRDEEQYSDINFLPPFVVYGKKAPKFNERDLLTTKAFASVILKRYHYSAFSIFQYKEDVRLDEMAKLQNFADILRIHGDLLGSRDMEKMRDLVFDRSRDSESITIDKLLNSRFR